MWEELGNRMKNNADVVIAKIDLTANDVDVVGATINSYPTILLFKNGQKKKPILYTGKRELLALASFLETSITPDNAIRRDL